jgi:photosystem II protein PsbQ
MFDTLLKRVSFACLSGFTLAISTCCVAQDSDPVMKSKFRSVLALALTLVMVLCVAFVNPAEAKPKKGKPQTYSTEQVAEIQSYAAQVQEMRDRFGELQTLIEKEDYIFARNFIHGPLGELRTKMVFIANDLFPDARKQAQEATKDLGNALAAIDRAGAEKDYKAAAKGYTNLNRALDAFFALLPQ